MKNFIFDLQIFSEPERTKVYVGSEILQSSSNYVDIIGNAENNTVKNYEGAYVSISGGAGNDSLVTFSKSFSGAYSLNPIFATINGGEGDDTINNIICQYSHMSDTLGNNYISNSGASSTILTGDGKDTIVLNSESHTSPYNGSTVWFNGSKNYVLTLAEEMILLRFPAFLTFLKKLQ